MRELRELCELLSVALIDTVKATFVTLLLSFFFDLHVKILYQFAVLLGKVLNPKSPGFGCLLDKNPYFGDKLLATVHWCPAIHGS